MNFNLGQRAIVTGEIRRVSDGALVDPVTLRVKVRNPRLEITTYVYGVDAEITRPSTGEYEISILLDKPGEWLIRFEGNDSNETSEQTTLGVDGSAFYDSAGLELVDS